MKINKEWHDKNRMPETPTFEEKVKWHLSHQQNCQCRPIPKKLAAEMIQKGIAFKL